MSRTARTSTTPSPRPRRCSRSGHGKSGSIVVLSDGANTGGTHDLAGVTDAARAAHIQIYTIGLKDKTYSAGTLKALAAARRRVRRGDCK